MKFKLMYKKRRVPWIRVRFEIFTDLNALTVDEKMARSIFLLDSSRRAEMIEELQLRKSAGRYKRSN